MEAEKNVECRGGGAGGMLSLVGTPIGNLGFPPAAAETFRRRRRGVLRGHARDGQTPRLSGDFQTSRALR